jgi:nucleoside-diphosphate-sugar epimerase
MRIFPLYGEKEKSHRIFSLATKNAKTNKDTILFNGSQRRSFLHVKFAVRSLFKSIFIKKKSNKRNIWHIASRNSLTIEDFVKKIYKKYSSKGKIILKKNKINYDNNHHVSDVVSIWR